MESAHQMSIGRTMVDSDRNRTQIKLLMGVLLTEGGYDDGGITNKVPLEES